MSRKSWMTFAAAAVALVIAGGPVRAQQPAGQAKPDMAMSAPKSRTATITGVVVDVSCSAAMPGDAQNARLKPYAEQRVRVTGKVFDAGGANAIQIASIDRVS